MEPQQEMHKAQAPLYGLVLAGGKSQRMGQDKGLLQYHGKPQREYLADLLGPICSKVFISCRPDQVESVSENYQSLADAFLNLGPLGGILSAFQEAPNVAWLVVACDLPLLDEGALQQLIQSRNKSKVATAFQSPINKFPEPLIAIWEPSAHTTLLSFLDQGCSSPRKVLMNTDIELIHAKRPETLINVNRPEKLEEIRKKLANT